MWRSRRVRLVALLLVLAGTGGGYWLDNRNPSPVLRTLTIGIPSALDVAEESNSSLWFYDGSGATPTEGVIDTRNGILRSAGSLAHAGMPMVDGRSGHMFDGTGPNTLSMLDAHTATLLRTIPVPPSEGMFNGFLLSAYRDGWWSRTLRRVKGWAGWLPFKAPAQPLPPTTSTVMMLNLAR